jgi:hypothetical protein
VIVFRRVESGLYRAYTGDDYHLATIRDTGRTVRDDGAGRRLGRWQLRTPSGAGIGFGTDTLAQAKDRVREFYGPRK